MANGGDGSGIDVSQSVAFLKAAFQPSDLIHFRLIESWTELDTGKAASHVVAKTTKHRLGLSVPSLIDPAESIWQYLPDSEIARQIESMAPTIESERANVYFGVCPRFGGGGKYEQAWQIRQANCLWVDVDHVEIGEVAERCTTAGLPPPTIAVNSGGGVHLYWCLNVPYLIDDAEPIKPPSIETEWIDAGCGKRKPREWFIDPETGEKSIYSVAVRPPLSDRALLFQDVLAGIGMMIGGDATHDLPRIMRLPGTLNRKSERHGQEPRPCVLVRCEPSLRYDFDSFLQYAEKSPSRRERAAIRVMRLPAKKDKISNGRGGNKAQRRFDDLINDCAAAEISTRSEADFALCCAAIEQGWPKDEVWASATQVGKFDERGEGYFHLTWEKAKQHTRERIYFRHRDRQLKRAEGNADKAATTIQPTNGQETEHGPHNENNASVDPSTNGKLEVPMFGDEIPLTDTAEKLGELISKNRQHYRRGGVVQRIMDSESGEPSLHTVRPASLPCDFESVAKLVRMVRGEDGGTYSKPTTCGKADAELIMSSAVFLNQLPPIRVVSPCPVLVDINGKLTQVHGYNRECGVLAYGPEIHMSPLQDAKDLLNKLTSQFRYVSESDRSRHLASIITPALIHGQLIGSGKRAPMDLTEADESQTGKGFKNKMTAAIYNQTVCAVKQRTAGVGSIEEEFDRAIAGGRMFISFDNIRGNVNIPALESYLTEDTYTARFAHSPPISIDVSSSGTVVMFTSNAADMTIDLAKRSSIVRLLKQRDDFEFAEFREGNILDHVRANWGQYLGAVFAVVAEWHKQGRQRIARPDHSFREWASTLDWIVRNVMNAAPLLDDHKEAQGRVSTPFMGWLREIAVVIEKEGKANEWLRASEIVEIIAESTVAAPGVTAATNMEDENDAAKIFRAMGRRLGRCFGKKTTLKVDRFLIEKDEREDDSMRPKKMYRFSLTFSDVDGVREQAELPQPAAATVRDSGDDRCEDGGRHDWHDSQESDGKIRRFCTRCRAFGGIIETDPSLLF